MSDNLSTSITIFIAAASAIGSMVAAIAAWRSSSAAKQSLKGSEEEGYRRLRRQLAVVGQRVVSKSESINRLCDELKLQYATLAVFSGAKGGSREKMFRGRAVGYKEEVAALIDEANRNILDRELSNVGPHEIDHTLVSFSMKLEHISEMQETIKQEKTEIDRQITIFQERAINSG